MSDLMKRFQGAENAFRLRQAILGQKLIGGDADLGTKFIARGQLRHLSPGETLIEQGAWDTDLFLILAGNLDIVINGQLIAVRSAGVHVGELSGADPARSRTATVVAKDEVLVFQVPEQAINEIAGSNPEFWRRAMNVAAERLDERNAKLGKTNDIPRVFVISSSEGKHVADEIAVNLDGKEIAVQIWDKGTFGVSDYPISSLMDAIEAADFTISIVRSDDDLIMRGKKSSTARDNVHLEYGISLGVLGRLRSLLLVCADENLHLPSDLAGLTTLRYRDGSQDELHRSVRNACIEAKKHISAEGVFHGRRLS